MSRPALAVVGLAAGVLAAAAPGRAEVRVASLIGDHMVVQQGQPTRLWGTASPGETVRASLAGAAGSATADATGSWQLSLAALPAGGPHTLVLEGTNKRTFTDVWAGEVWLASGQSNMEWPLSQSKGGAEAVAAGCDGLHLFTVAKATAAEPKADVDGAWQSCDAGGALSFSAVALLFGQELHRALGVPVGLIHASWGGTPAESWTPRAALVAEPSLAPMLRAFDAALHDPVARREIASTLADWETRSFHQDTGNAGVARGFAAADGGGPGWARMELPRFWEDAGLKIDGAVWFRRDVALPADWAGHDLALALGPIDDFDLTYWNGEAVGATGAETPQYWSAARRYTVPGRLARAGRNVIAVRVFDHYGNGGFGGSPAQMSVVPVRGGAALGLAGAWDYRIERALEPAVVDFSTRPSLLDAENPNSPTVLWNAMLAPLTAYPLAGALWYQGEANAGRAYEYRTLFPAMIRAWRGAWSRPDLPFVFVQLPLFHAFATQPAESDWAELREAQALTLKLPRTAMAVTLDLGDPDDVHPRDKREVARRLAAQALKAVYAREVTASGPVLRDAAREGAAMRVRLAEAAGGLTTTDGAPPRGFAIAGADRRWRWADARIDGDSVVVSSPEVPEPVAVRYGWADNPPETLRNRAGLPAAPFRTDDWPGVTSPR